MKPQPKDDTWLLKMLAMALIGFGIYDAYTRSSRLEFLLATVGTVAVASIVVALVFDRYSKTGRERQRKLAFIREVPTSLIRAGSDSIKLGVDVDLGAQVYLPDSLRSKHVHIIGATGSGKTESVILSFIRQDVARGIGSIILDAKGDVSFLATLGKWVPREKLKLFDLSTADSLSYNPLDTGSPLEAAQRLFSSLTWSEEYYKSKAFAALQRLFQLHHERYEQNPKLIELDHYLADPKTYASFVQTASYPQKLAEADFSDLSGLRDQVRILTIGHLKTILSPKDQSEMQLTDVEEGAVLYFRLQSLLSPQLVTIVGRLLINHINYLAGTAHRAEARINGTRMIPTYFDEFASFACPEFADLISKARSAGFALHFSHQSIGDLMEVSEGFINQITDNSATKIVMRINDPDSAEYFARAYGTKLYQKVTQRITNSEEIDTAEVLGEGSQREAHRFRASPDLFKTLPTGMGSVLIAHGSDTPHGASSVFKIKFPRLESPKPKQKEE